MADDSSIAEFDPSKLKPMPGPPSTGGGGGFDPSKLKRMPAPPGAAAAPAQGQKGFAYDPKLETQLETGTFPPVQTENKPLMGALGTFKRENEAGTSTQSGLKSDPIQPGDLLSFGTAGAFGKLGEAAAEGVPLLSRAALGPAAREAAKVATSFPLMQYGSDVAKPASQALEQMGPVGQVAGGTLDIAAGMAPLVALEGGPGSLQSLREKAGGIGTMREQATEAAGKAEGAATEAKAAMAEHGAEARKQTFSKMEDFRAQKEKQIAPESHQEALRGEVGPVKPVAEPIEQVQTQGGPAALPGPGQIARQKEFKDAFFGVRQRGQDEMSKRWNQTFEPHVDRNASTTELKTAVEQANAYARQNGIQYSPKVRKLIDDANNLIYPGRVKPTGMSKRAATSAGALPQKITTTTGVPYGGVQGGTKDVVAKVGQLLGFRSNTGKVLSEVASHDKYATRLLREASEADLTSTGVPGAEKLRAQYTEWKKGLGDDDFAGKVGQSADPTEVHKALFQHPQIGLQAMSGATDEEKAVFRSHLAEYVHGGGAIDKSMAPTLKAAGFGKALSNPDSWAFREKAEQRLGDTIDNSPQAKAKFEGMMQEHARELQDTNDKASVKEALKHVKALGANGTRLRAAIDAAPTLEAKAKAAQKFFGDLNPEAAGKEAGIGAIQNFQTPELKGIAGYMKRRAAFGVLIGAMGGFGHPVLSAGMLGGFAIKDALAKSFQNSLRDPAEAERQYQAIINPGVEKNLRYLAGKVVESSMPPTVSKLGHPSDDPPPEEPDGIGPMTKDLDRKQAVAIASREKAGDEGHLDHIQGLHKDIAGGKTPDVQHDLASGRLSNAEVLKMVDNSPTTVGSMFKNMSLGDAMDAFQKGSQQEKEMAFQPLVQKLNDEGRNLQPDQRRAVLAQLRRALAEQGETV